MDDVYHAADRIEMSVSLGTSGAQKRRRQEVPDSVLEQIPFMHRKGLLILPLLFLAGSC